MTLAAVEAAGHKQWLSQGDVFSSVLLAQAAVTGGVVQAVADRAPAMLMTHGCAIDKKRRHQGRVVSRVEYLTFVPIKQVATLPNDRAETLRTMGQRLEATPYEAMYLGDVTGLGEVYTAIGLPFTIPAVLLRPELKLFTAAETGDTEDHRLVPTIGDTRVGTLNADMIRLLHVKWAANWLSRDLVFD